MELQKLRTEDDAVSPVIGVILMVAITVILAAVIGTFVLGIGSQQQTVPQASFDFVLDKSTNSLTITHDGGDTLNEDNTAEVQIKGAISGAPVQWTVPVESGDQKTVSVTGDGKARIFWKSASGGKSSILATFEIDV